MQMEQQSNPSIKIKHEIGAIVSHAKYGIGRVVGYNSIGGKHTVEFASGERRYGLLVRELTQKTAPQEPSAVMSLSSFL